LGLGVRDWGGGAWSSALVDDQSAVSSQMVPKFKPHLFPRFSVQKSEPGSGSVHGYLALKTTLLGPR